MSFKEHFIIFLRGLGIMFLSLLIVIAFVGLMILLSKYPVVVGGIVLAIIMLCLSYVIGLMNEEYKLKKKEEE